MAVSNFIFQKNHLSKYRIKLHTSLAMPLVRKMATFRLLLIIVVKLWECVPESSVGATSKCKR